MARLCIPSAGVIKQLAFVVGENQFREDCGCI